MSTTNTRERLVSHVQELERLQDLKKRAGDDLKAGFEAAAAAGFDTPTLKAVLKLRTQTPNQRAERRALEAIYLAALGMLEGDPLPSEARRRLDEDRAPSAPTEPSSPSAPRVRKDDAPVEPAPHQPPLELKDPAEARQEGASAAAAGQRIYDNPYPAGDPCRAAWDEGWCTRSNAHGMETPAAYRRRTDKPADPAPKDGKSGDGDSGDAAGPGTPDAAKRGAA